MLGRGVGVITAGVLLASSGLDGCPWLPDVGSSGGGGGDKDGTTVLNQPICSDVRVKQLSSNIRSFAVPTGACASVKSTPVVVNGVLLMPYFEKDAKTGCSKGETGPYAQSLLAYNPSTGDIHKLLEGAPTEGTLSYDSATGRIYWPVLSAGAVWIIDADDLDISRKVEGIRAQTDSHGTFLDGLFYFGTINDPGKSCNTAGDINKDCGALYAVDDKGNIKHRLDVDDGFRTWVVGGPTTDGESLYIGGSPECDGDACWPDDKGYKYRYGCSVIKTDKSLKILKSFDPGITGCLEGGNTEDAIAGEIVLGKKGDLWVQYGRPNDRGGDTYIYHLDKDLNVQCSFGVDYSEDLAARSSGFYQAPTVDSSGDAYVTFNLPRTNSRSNGSALYKVEPCTQGCGAKTTCKATELQFAEGLGAFASPTLADDRYALFAPQGELRVVNTSTGKVAGTFELGDNEEVHASPVIYKEDVYVLSVAGTLTVIEDAGVSGYGDAIWPRFRANNRGSARPSWAP
jgi:hypothetical protein